MFTFLQSCHQIGTIYPLRVAFTEGAAGIAFEQAEQLRFMLMFGIRLREISLLIIFTCLLTACPRSKESSRAAAAPTIEQLKADCAGRILTQMKDGEISFTPVAGVPLLERLTSMNELIAANREGQGEFKIVRRGIQIVGLGVGRGSQDRNFSFESALHGADPDTSFFFSLKLEATEADDHGHITIAETFNVDQNCDLRLGEVTAETLRIKRNKITTRLVSHQMDGQAGADKDEVNIAEVPRGGHLLDRSETKGVESLADMEKLFQKYKDRPIYLASGAAMPLVRAEYKKLPPFKLNRPVDQEEILFHGYESRYFLNDKGEGVRVQVAQSEDSSTMLTRNLNSNVENWSVPEELWDRAEIHTENPHGQHSYTLDADVHAGNILATIETSRKLDYLGLSQYWTILEQHDLQNDARGWVWRADMKPKPWPENEPSSSAALVDRKNHGHPYLKESDYVHYNIPQLRQQIDLLREHSHLNRMQMAEKVLKLVHSLLEYDHESVKQNSVYPLKTEDILARKKGVCQHYAILFASLARAVGLPTKIITGFMISGKNQFGAHAWNEVEVQEGVWRPIDPQLTMEFTTYAYIPVSEGYFLESKEINDQTLSSMLGLSYTQFSIHYSASK